MLKLYFRWIGCMGALCLQGPVFAQDFKSPTLEWVPLENQKTLPAVQTREQKEGYLLRPDEHLEIKGKPFKVIQAVGRGGLGQIYLVENVETGERIAFKIVRVKDVEQVDELDAAYRLFSSLKFDRIVRPSDIEKKRFGQDLYVTHTMPYIEDYNVLSSEKVMPMFQLSPDIDLTPDRIRDWMQNAVRLLDDLQEIQSELYQADLVHHDIKPANLILDAQLRVVLVDADLMSRRGPGSRFKGTVAYMSPDILQARSSHKISKVSAIESHPSSDAFALGATFYEMIFGEKLFAAISSSTTLSSSDLHALVQPYMNYTYIEGLIQSHMQRIRAVACPEGLCADTKLKSDLDRVEEYLTISLDPVSSNRFKRLLNSPTTQHLFNRKSPPTCDSVGMEVVTILMNSIAI